MGPALRWEGPGLANQERGECVALWPEDSSYSWCGSKQLLGQGAEKVTGTERPPGELSEAGIPSEDPGRFLPFYTIIRFACWAVAVGGGLDPNTYGLLIGGEREV